MTDIDSGLMRIYPAPPMFPTRSMVTAVLAALLLLTALPAPAEERMYRYTNAEGMKVVAYQVPPEFVANGYEILNARGILVGVVPRQLVGEARGEQARLEREAAEEEERLRAWDESLLLRYSTLEDIEAARERALRDLRIRVSILTSKLSSLKQQVESYQALAADQERSGQTVDAAYLTGIEDLRAEIGATERALEDRRQEIEEVTNEYARDLERFATLLDMVELRRSRSAGS